MNIMAVSYTHLVNHDQQALLQCDIFLVGNLNNGDLAGIRSLTAVSYTHLDVYKRQHLFLGLALAM